MSKTMRKLIFTVFNVVAMTLLTFADEKLATLKVGSETYSNVTVFKVTATDIFFTSDKGVSNAKLKDIEPVLQKQFNYNSSNAIAAEQKQIKANLQYQVELLKSGANISKHGSSDQEGKMVSNGVNQVVMSYREKTEYFDFYCQQESPTIHEIIRFADGFVRLVNHDFFKANFDYPIRVLVFQDRAQFEGFLVQQLHILNPHYGIYLPAYKLFATYDGSGLGTFAHEILHPLTGRNLTEQPQWAIEGIPTFFEKFYGYWEGNKLVAYWGYQNPWRIRELGDALTRLDLKQILTSTVVSGAVERGESGIRMVSVFLWKEGKFKRFLDLIAAHDKQGYPTYFEAAMEMPVDKVLPLWQNYLNDAVVNRKKNLSLPVSQIFDNQAEFEVFIKENGISLEQPARQ